MRAGLVVTGVLGLGTAVVFAIAAMTATLFPNGTVVATNPWGNPVMRNWGGDAIAVPMPMPAIDVAPVVIEAAPGVVAGDQVISEDGTRELAPAP